MGKGGGVHGVIQEMGANTHEFGFPDARNMQPKLSPKVSPKMSPKMRPKSESENESENESEICADFEPKICANFWIQFFLTPGPQASCRQKLAPKIGAKIGSTFGLRRGCILFPKILGAFRAPFLSC